MMRFSMARGADVGITVFWSPPPDAPARVRCERAIHDALRACSGLADGVTVQFSMARDGVLRVRVQRQPRRADSVSDLDLTFRVVDAIRNLGVEAMPNYR
jgi:hypothetical protein